MRRRERIYPPNCTVCDLNPSRLLEFVAKQRRVFAEYGFWLSVPLRSPEEKLAPPLQGGEPRKTLGIPP